MTRRSYLLFAAMGAIGCATLVMPACSSPVPVSSPTPEQWVYDLSATFCGAMRACCTAAHYSFDGDACTTTMTARFYRSLHRPHVVFDQNALAACKQAYASREARCVDDAGASDPITAACSGVARGTQNPGDACDDASECAAPDQTASVGCQPDPDPASDTYLQTRCVQIAHGAQPGTSCDEKGATVQHTCDSMTGYCLNQQCKAWGKPGDCCDSSCNNALCGPSSNCKFVPNNPGTCVSVAAGSPCKYPLGDCGGSGSVLTCDSATHSCITPKPVGAACLGDFECASYSCPRLNLDGGAAGQCAAPSSHSIFDVSPRTCGFGPSASGAEDAGFVR